MSSNFNTLAVGSGVQLSAVGSCSGATGELARTFVSDKALNNDQASVFVTGVADCGAAVLMGGT